VLVEQFEQIEDPYLRERKSDVLQVGERVLKRLMGRPGVLPQASAEEQTILVAHDLSPAVSAACRPSSSRCTSLMAAEKRSTSDGTCAKGIV
jgi:phosphoenolpyruvate-protein kinase (PTS system EI component)